MRGKQAKRLRKQAAAFTIGLSRVDYVIGVPGNPHGVELKPNCTRFRYKELKKQFKQ